MILAVNRLKGNGTEFGQVLSAVSAQHAFVYADVDDPANDVAFFRGLDVLALQGDGQLDDERGVYLSSFRGS